METKTYVGLDGLQWYTTEMFEYIKDQILTAKTQTVVNADSYLKFPSIGDSNCLYVDISSNKIYRWDDGDLKYFVVGNGDYDDIQIIDGTGK